MNKQNLLSGAAPHGSYQSSQKVDVTFFTETEDLKREEEIRTRMPFLHNLVQAKLQNSYDSRRRLNATPTLKRKQTDNERVPGEDSDTEESTIYVDPPEDDDTLEAEKVEGVSYVPEMNGRQAEAHRLRMVSRYAFCCRTMILEPVDVDV